MPDGTPMRSFEECWEWIRRARREDWVHKRRGVGLRDIPLDRILLRVAEETGELSQAHTRDGNELEELADCFAILMHFGIAKGFSTGQVVEKMQEKLELHIVPRDGGDGKARDNHGTVGEYSPDEVFAHVPPIEDRRGRRDKALREYVCDGIPYLVGMASLRYYTFMRSRRCACCGIEGVKFKLQVPRGSKSNRAHFNLFAVDDDGEEVLMTKDHILPKSKKGKDTIDNMQTLCCKCNSLKGNDEISMEELRERRAQGGQVRWYPPRTSAPRR